MRYWSSQAARGWEYYANGLRTATVTLTQRDDGILSLLGRERGEGAVHAACLCVCLWTGHLNTEERKHKRVTPL